MIREDLRNIAIIAHVDHGKTTLVDEMLKQSGAFRQNQVVEERVMDSNDIEKERGITILAKNTAVKYGDIKINIVDTPGHADFGGEVERVLKMVDGVLLLVDAFEGPMPQTRFVLQKALELNHPIIIAVNKIDKPNARCKEVVDEVLGLLIDLDATEEQLESPILYCSGRNGTATIDLDTPNDDFKPLFDCILKSIPAPQGTDDDNLQVLVSAIDYSEYVGTIAIGKITKGKITQGQNVTVCNFESGNNYKGKINTLYTFSGLSKVQVEECNVGDIICFSGIENITIGDTVCTQDVIDPVEFVNISKPTIEMTFSVNDSPFAGKEGKFVTSRQLRERLYKELLKDVSLKVSETESTESFNVAGRGEMHISILIENMRREGYEFSVSTPRVLYQEIDGQKCEPIENVVIDVPEEYMGSVMEKLGSRKGICQHMSSLGTRMRLEFSMPSRGLFGYRSEFLTDTKGEGILNTLFEGYKPYKGEIKTRSQGSLVAFEAGDSVTYGLFNAQDRGILFIGAGVPVYEGMIVGANAKNEDLIVNVCKKKQVTNMRASGSDESLKLVPYKKLSLEEALEFINDDELVEVTPESIRLRKKILNKNLRQKSKK